MGLCLCVKSAIALPHGGTLDIFSCRHGRAVEPALESRGTSDGQILSHVLAGLIRPQPFKRAAMAVGLIPLIFLHKPCPNQTTRATN